MFMRFLVDGLLEGDEVTRPSVVVQALVSVCAQGWLFVWEGRGLCASLSTYIGHRVLSNEVKPK
jgi:hypothetical protein